MEQFLVDNSMTMMTGLLYLQLTLFIGGYILFPLVSLINWTYKTHIKGATG